MWQPQKQTGANYFLFLIFFSNILQFLLKHTRHAYSVHFEHFLCEMSIQLSFTLIEHEQYSKNRLRAKTPASLLLTQRSCLTLTRCSCSRCECTHLLTCTPKNIRYSRAAQACGVKRPSDYNQFLVTAADKGVPSLRGTATVVVKVSVEPDKVTERGTTPWFTFI